MSDAWNEIQAVKSKRNSLREKLEKRKRERQDIFIEASAAAGVVIGHNAHNVKTETPTAWPSSAIQVHPEAADPDVERLLLQILSDQALVLPISGGQLFQRMNALRFKPIGRDVLNYFLEKLAAQSYISIQLDEQQHQQQANNAAPDALHQHRWYEVTSVEHARVQSLHEQLEEDADVKIEDAVKRKCESPIIDSTTGATTVRFGCDS